MPTASMRLSKSVRKELERARPPAPGAQVMLGPDRVDIAARLRRVAMINTVIFVLAAAMAVVIGLAVLLLLYRYQDQIEHVRTILGAGGAGFAGLIALVGVMVHVAKAYTQSNLVLLMISGLPVEDQSMAIKALLEADEAASKSMRVAPAAPSVEEGRT